MLFSHSVMSNSLLPHGLQHARLPCPWPFPGHELNGSCSLSQWCHPIISSLDRYPEVNWEPLQTFKHRWDTITKRNFWVWPLGAQKPINRTGWWKGEGGGWQTSVQRPTSLPHDKQGLRAFIDRGEGLHAETAPSSLTVFFKLITSGLTSIILIVWGTVNP